MKIKQQLLLTHGLLVFLALLIVLINVIAFKGMESDGVIINNAGRLRAISYNMAQISSRINSQESNNSIVDLKRNLKLKIKEFDDILIILSESKEKPIVDINHNETTEKIEKVSQEWNETFKPLYLKMVESKLTDKTSSEINKNIDSYVNNIDEMVTSYSLYGSKKVRRALEINGGLILLLIIVVAYSFKSTNKRIRKPMQALLEELKELSLIDDEIAIRFKNMDTNEISQMAGYFNEMMYDQLTKTFNRRSGLAKLGKTLEDENKDGYKISLCFIDINGLKSVNDHLGHEMGDELIVSAIDNIKQEIRDNDFIIRMGGDEFLIVLKGIGKEISEKVWDRINKRYENINSEEDRPYVVSVSHGIVECDDCERLDIDSLLRDADEKMYVEKRYIKEELKIQIIREKIEVIS